jgi:hypothetical protein
MWAEKALAHLQNVARVCVSFLRLICPEPQQTLFEKGKYHPNSSSLNKKKRKHKLHNL